MVIFHSYVSLPEGNVRLDRDFEHHFQLFVGDIFKKNKTNNSTVVGWCSIRIFTSEICLCACHVWSMSHVKGATNELSKTLSSSTDGLTQAKWHIKNHATDEFRWLWDNSTWFVLSTSFNPSEKYEFASWDDDIFNIKNWKISKIPWFQSHFQSPPTSNR